MEAASSLFMACLPWEAWTVIFVIRADTQRVLNRAHFSVGEKKVLTFFFVNINMILLKNRFIIGINSQNKSDKNLIYLNPLGVWNGHFLNIKSKFQLPFSSLWTVVGDGGRRHPASALCMNSFWWGHRLTDQRNYITGAACSFRVTLGRVNNPLLM